MPNAAHRAPAGLPQPLHAWRASAALDTAAEASAALARGVMLRLCELHGLGSPTLDRLGGQPAHRVWRPAGAAGALLDALLPPVAHEPAPGWLDDERAHALASALCDPATTGALRACAPEDLSALFEQIRGVTAAGARRSAGVYYTPAEIVSYITVNTVGALLPERGPHTRLRVLDPACGAGTFLLAALRALDAARGPGGATALPDIYGVDLDPYAVAAARLTLLLATEHRGRLEALLQTLAARVVWGNALVAGGDAPGRADALVWEHAFPEAIDAGGFDAIVGNPPYLNLKRGAIGADEKRHYTARYAAARGQYDAFGLFMERALELLAPGGAQAFVVPRPLLTATSYEPVRRMLLRRRLVVLADAGTPFRAAVEAAVVVVRNAAPGPPVRLERIQPGAAPRALGFAEQRLFDELPAHALSFRVTERVAPLICRLAHSEARVGDALLSLTRGLELGKRAAALQTAGQAGARPLLRGEDVGRYWARPAVLSHAGARPGAGPPRTAILLRRVAGRIEAALDQTGSATLNTLYTLVPRPGVDHWLLLACLNARLTSDFLRVVYLSDDRLFPYLRMAQIAALPLPAPQPGDGDARREAAALAKQLQALHSTPAATPGVQSQPPIKDQIAAAERRLDALVYRLFALSEDEIALVEADPEGRTAMPVPQAESTTAE